MPGSSPTTKYLSKRLHALERLVEELVARVVDLEGRLDTKREIGFKRDGTALPAGKKSGEYEGSVGGDYLKQEEDDW
jgi:hypothetical protein